MLINNLKRIHRIHIETFLSKEKYNCGECDKQVVYNYSMKTHMVIKHIIAIYFCLKCGFEIKLLIDFMYHSGIVHKTFFCKPLST